MNRARKSAQLFCGLVAIAGLAVLGYGIHRFHPTDHVRFLAFLFIALLASRLKLKLPGLNSSMSFNLPFILIALAELSISEVLIIGTLSTLVQCVPGSSKTMRPVQIMFNVFNMANAVGLAFLVFNAWQNPHLSGKSLLLALAAATFCLADTLPVGIIITLTENLKLAKVWREIFLLTFPYFVLSAGLAAIVITASRYVGWQAPLFTFPVMYAVYRSFRMYFATRKEMQMTAEVALCVSQAD